jgi:hypothetical protein
MEFLYVGLGMMYVWLVVTLGVMTFGGGHYWMFWLGFFFPLLWIIGGLIAPTEASRRAHALEGTA